MSMSPDGYIAGPNDEPDNPGGDGFMRLHEWFGFGPDGPDEKIVLRPPAGPAGELVDEYNATGAVLAGRRTAEQAGHWGAIITVFRSSWSVISRQIPRWQSIPW
jgi:hypothetical protein